MCVCLFLTQNSTRKHNLYALYIIQMCVNEKHTLDGASESEWVGGVVAIKREEQIALSPGSSSALGIVFPLGLSLRTATFTLMML